MPELRRDPVIDRWVIIATERGKRPSDFGSAQPRKRGGFCPFCYGNESLTPPEILAFRRPGTEPNKPGWLTRVVSNKFPALKIEGELEKVGEGMYDKMSGIGAHEVIIETPEHDATMGTMDKLYVVNTLKAYRERIIDLARDKRFKYVMVFKNYGEAAGASLEHPHSQLIATPIVPKRVLEELHGSQRYFSYKDRCVFCDMVRQELKDEVRLVLTSDNFVVFEAYASRFPFETWLLPRKHMPKYEHMGDDLIEELAEVLQRTIRKLELTLSYPPYNYIIHTAPLREPDDLEYYHWHIEIIPRLTKMAGFEWGTGFYINPTPPEEAAKYLREAEEGKVEEVAAANVH
ncbi:galactose-1-phosphate uridylyltransferase [Candidatus Poribacteria bacterium]|nr:MAG: galactose-1-phosphate uridylyltransferase [Candidatus Poribacteria bacterium]